MTTHVVAGSTPVAVPLEVHNMKDDPTDEHYSFTALYGGPPPNAHTLSNAYAQALDTELYVDSLINDLEVRRIGLLARMIASDGFYVSQAKMDEIATWSNDVAALEAEVEQLQLSLQRKHQQEAVLTPICPLLPSVITIEAPLCATPLHSTSSRSPGNTGMPDSNEDGISELKGVSVPHMHFDTNLPLNPVPTAGGSVLEPKDHKIH
jgi:hypothetical protein